MRGGYRIVDSLGLSLVNWVARNGHMVERCWDTEPGAPGVLRFATRDEARAFVRGQFDPVIVDQLGVRVIADRQEPELCISVRSH